MCLWSLADAVATTASATHSQYWKHILIAYSIQCAGCRERERAKQLSQEFIVPATDYLHTLNEIPISQAGIPYLCWWRINALHATFTTFSHKLRLTDEVLVQDCFTTPHKSPLEDPVEHSQARENLHSHLHLLLHIKVLIWQWTDVTTNIPAEKHTEQINPSDECRQLEAIIKLWCI